MLYRCVCLFRMKNRLKLLQRISFLIFAIRSNFYCTTNTTKMQKIKLLKKNKASPFTRLLQNQLNIQQFVHIRHVFVRTAIFKPVVNYPGNFNTLLERDISVFFGLCICINKKKFLSFPCFLRTFVTRPLFSDIHRFIFLVLFCLYFSSCYNLLAELSSLTLSQCLYIFRFSLPYILFCFVSLFFISFLNGVQIWW